MNFYTELDNIKQDPQHWYIYSGNAYELSQEGENPGKLLQELVSELEKIDIKLGWHGFDAHKRYIYIDYYGMAYYPSEESIEFIKQKYAQYKRVNALLMHKRTLARGKYDKADNICKTSHKPTQSRINRTEAYDRIGELDKLSTIIWQCLHNYRRNFEVEFNILGI